MSETLELSSGARIPDPSALLTAFFAEEWAYYDGVGDQSPQTIEPIDVVVTVSVNSFLNSATRIRSVHRGIAKACDSLLQGVPVEADLRTFPLDDVVGLLHAACQVKWVLVPVAAKVLHRKRPHLIPMLDTVVSDYYLASTGRLDLKGAREDRRRAAEAARVPLEAFREDLNECWDQLTAFRVSLANQGYSVTQLRILEVLIWMWADPLRQYLGRLGDNDA
ncbi:MAG: hypothetical protein HZA58_03205 [Acidimicrobiia bacterium]|nr:hypothetical protein [Acidimicrobiia bacterium]